MDRVDRKILAQLQSDYSQRRSELSCWAVLGGLRRDGRVLMRVP